MTGHHKTTHKPSRNGCLTVAKNLLISDKTVIKYSCRLAYAN